MCRKSPSGGVVGAAIVIEHDDHGPGSGTEVVQALPCHAPGEGAITDHRDDTSVALPLQGQCFGDAVHPGEADRGMGVLDPVMWRFMAVGIPR
ncbi:Uncharacterised protein [Mycobacterium tuberculosis]|uniref:Uncharacterized protein n=1 Tax=Mycobacterium tuberculosis TaxID=1773 RepID=A0A916LBS3_MYCTX|nr:Uncharacterised protein [Mycobacterium tuberculosis]CKT09926.1 Uncharacterised protein [Mycobacterium tuberculosis]COW40584.1 Uncharacterised protein [Mycobacterium tuberculosis]COY34762.1 Uncharacterised protein [Mycobacterium tuberculosis]